MVGAGCQQHGGDTYLEDGVWSEVKDGGRRGRRVATLFVPQALSQMLRKLQVARLKNIFCRGEN